MIMPSAPSEIRFPEKLQAEGVLAGLWDVGELRISGQPSQDAFRKMAADGVKTVINLRGTSEMNDRTVVSFDEAAFLKELGVDYVHIPVGEQHEYNFSAVKRFADALERGKPKGKVLLHCTVAWRASYVWGTYLHKFRNYDLNEAIRHAESMHTSANRVERLLGITMGNATEPQSAAVPKAIAIPAGFRRNLSAPKPVFSPKDDAFMDWTLWEMGD